VIVARDRHGATTDAVLLKLNRVSITAALGRIVTTANEFCCDGGTAIVAFARRAGIPTHILPMPGKPNPSAPDFHINNVCRCQGGCPLRRPIVLASARPASSPSRLQRSLREA
jgi:hypothetical protein